MTRAEERASKVLGIEVPDALLKRWVTWFAPESQPFVVPEDSPVAGAGREFVPADEAEIRDSFELYVPERGTVFRSIRHDEFTSFPPATRSRLVRDQVHRGRSLVPSVRAWPSLRDEGISKQGDGHRFVWWPNLMTGREREVLTPYVEDGRRSSCHPEVDSRVWVDIAGLLPSARELAGTFPLSSGPNCFGTVMGAAGVCGAANTWMKREPFESWLSAATRPGGRDYDPGTVLVWRSSAGVVQHAGVTLGRGWALHKPSQGWMSPVKVLAVGDVLRSSRGSDRRLSRRTLA